MRAEPLGTRQFEQVLIASSRGGGEADIASIGSLVADRGRCQMLMALADGRSLSASQLAAEAGVRPATASSHLGKLTAAGLLRVQTDGRFRHYQLAGPDVVRLLQALQQLAPTLPITSFRQDTRAHALRCARTCFDHVAGRVGVGILDALVTRRFVNASFTGDGALRTAVADVDELAYEVTDDGIAFFSDFGVMIPQQSMTLRHCMDWSERRHHLGGTVGYRMRERMIQLGWISPARDSRALQVTADGRAGLARVFNLSADTFAR